MSSPTRGADSPAARTSAVPSHECLPAAGVALPRSRIVTSPVNPSPLRESSLASAVENMKLSTTPEGTPGIAQEEKKKLETTEPKTSLTPPSSEGASKGPVIVDGSRSNEYIAQDEPVIASVTSGDELVSQANPEDPFMSSPMTVSTTVLNTHAIPKEQAIARVQANIAMPQGIHGFSPRADRMGEPITAANAQALCDPEAAIFVANLPNNKSDDQLEVSVNAAFEVYGLCWPKIRRDKNGQPYAFIQFQHVADAELAIATANGSLIDGRVCRLEKAKAARELIISRIAGGVLTNDEAKDLLGRFGDLVSVVPSSNPSPDGSQAESFTAKYAFFQDSKDALYAYRNNQEYRVVPAPREPHTRPRWWKASPTTPDRRGDANSVFVGGLPQNVNEEHLRQTFNRYGTIESCIVISKPIISATGGINTFAFIEFRDGKSASAAIGTDITMAGLPLRVEAKQYSARRAARLAQSQTFSSPMSPASPATPQMLTYMYNNAVNMGIPAYQAANMYSTAQYVSPHMYTSTTPPAPMPAMSFNQATSPPMRGPPNMQQMMIPYNSPNVAYGSYQISTPSGAYGSGMHVISEEAEDVFDDRQ